MPHSPWMPFYVGDYLADTAHLTTEQHGAYLLLLFACWTMAKLPDDDAKLMSISRVKSPDEWLKLRKTLEPFFKISRGFWEQKRVSFELQKSSKLAKQHSEGGKKAALIRWGNKVKTKDSSAYGSANSSAYGSAVTRARVPQPHKNRSDTGVSDHAAVPHDPLKEIYDRGVAILGDRRPLLGKMVKEYGEVAVLEAIVACEEQRPVNPPGFLVACLKNSKGNGHAQTARSGPIDALHQGAARAAAAVILREREGAGGDQRAGFTPAEPLLDFNRQHNLAAAPDRGLAGGFARVPARRDC